MVISVCLLAGCQQGSETQLRFRADPYFGYISTSTLEMAPRGWYKGFLDDPLMTWDEANHLLKDIKIGGEKGWRLPTGFEIRWLCEKSENHCDVSENTEINRSWWLNSPIPNTSFVVAATPTFYRIFARRNEKLRVSPVKGKLDPDEDDSGLYGQDVEVVESERCLNNSKEATAIAWMNTCSKWTFCDWLDSSCVLDMSEIVRDKERLLVVVATGIAIDTYEYLPAGQWTRIAHQKFDWIIPPVTDDASQGNDAWRAEIGLTDFTGDGRSDLAIRVGPPVLSGESMDLAVFQWKSNKGGWVSENFPDASDENRMGSLVPNSKMLRWGHVYGSDVYENYGYFETGNFSDEVSLHYRWVNGKFKYMGEVPDLASEQCLLCPAGSID
jgi:hypothetical protein